MENDVASHLLTDVTHQVVLKIFYRRGAEIRRKKVKTEEEGDSRIEYFQIEARHKMFPDSLNIVMIRKTKLSSNKVGHVILFTSDFELAWDKIMEYYSLRFQIEFNFRDAKQYWGLEDFMVIKENKVRNSACFSMFMVNISDALITNSEGKTGQSVHDLKVWFLVRKQVLSTLKLCSGKQHLRQFSCILS